MASVWNKLTFSGRTSLPSDDRDAPPKLTMKQSLSARSRKSLSMIFPDVFGNPSTDKENIPAVQPDLNCKEAVNYPVYDPENSDHNTSYHSPSKSAHRSRSWSPLKKSLKSKPPSPTRMMTSSRKTLSDFAKSVKATAAGMRPSTPPSLLQDVSSMGRDSEKSVKSKKSVHWRSSDSTTAASGTNGQSLPKDKVKDSSPVLPDISYSDHFLGSKVALTARPPPTPILVALEQADQRPQSIELQHPILADITEPDLLTPMPGTNLPLQDPFDNTAAIPENDIMIFKDPDCASEQNGRSSEPAPHIEVLISVAPSSIATLAVSECLKQRQSFRASSNMYGTDNDSPSSEDADMDFNATTRAHPKPPNMRAVRKSSLEGLNINNIPRELQAAVPRVEAAVPVEDDAHKAYLGELQATSEVGSTVSLGSALGDSDKENQFHRHQSYKAGQSVYSGHANCGQGCRVPSLTEPAKQDVSRPDSPPRQPPVAQLTTARKLPPFHLQATVTSQSAPRDAPAFRFSNSSDESMSIVDETEFSWQARKDLLHIKDTKSTNTSPDNVPLPETPMPGVS